MHSVFVCATYIHMLNYDHQREPKRTVFDSQYIINDVCMYVCMYVLY